MKIENNNEKRYVSPSFETIELNAEDSFLSGTTGNGGGQGGDGEDTPTIVG